MSWMLSMNSVFVNFVYHLFHIRYLFIWSFVIGMFTIVSFNMVITLRWRHNGRDGVSNHQHHYCLLNRLFGCRSKKISKLRVTGLCVGTSPGTGEFSARMASNAENVSIWWSHHDFMESKKCNYINDIPNTRFSMFITLRATAMFPVKPSCVLKY